MSSIEPTVTLKTSQPRGTKRRRALTFAGTISTVLGAAGLWKVHRGFLQVGQILIGVAIALLIYSAVHPGGALALRRAWLRLGGFLGRINTAIILSVMYFLIVTPLGLLMRLGKRSFRADRHAPYSVPRKDRDRTHFEHPY